MLICINKRSYSSKSLSLKFVNFRSSSGFCHFQYPVKSGDYSWIRQKMCYFFHICRSKRWALVSVQEVVYTSKALQQPHLRRNISKSSCLSFHVTQKRSSDDQMRTALDQSNEQNWSIKSSKCKANVKEFNILREEKWTYKHTTHPESSITVLQNKKPAVKKPLLRKVLCEKKEGKNPLFYSL